MKNNVLLYFLAVGMISGWAVNDSNAMNMQNLPPMMPLQSVQTTKHQAIQPIQVQNMAQRSWQTQNIAQKPIMVPIQPMQSSQQTQVGKGKKKQGGQQNQMQQGIPQAKPTMPTMPSMQQAKPTMPAMPQVQKPEVTLTAEDRFKQRVREMMKSGSTELVIDEDYLGLKNKNCQNGSRLPIIADDTEVANYIREKVKTLVVNSGTIDIALESTRTNEEVRLLQQEEQNRQSFVRQYLNGGQQTSYDQLFQKELERRQSSLNTKYTKYPLWFGALENVILCNGSRVNVCETNLKDRYDVTEKCASIDFCRYFDTGNRFLGEDGSYKFAKRYPGMKKLYWWPNFGKYDEKDRSLELASVDEVKLLTDKIQTMTGQIGNVLDISYMFSKITFPKNAIVDACVFDVCNTIAIDCQSTKICWKNYDEKYYYNDKTEQKNVIMNGVQLITPGIKQRIIADVLFDGMFSSYKDFYEQEEYIKSQEAKLKSDSRWWDYLDLRRGNYDIYKRSNSNAPAYTPPSDDQIIRYLDPRFWEIRNCFLAKKNIIDKRKEKMLVWPKECVVLEKPDFTADDALLLARKAKLNVSDEIYIKEGIKWIGANSFSSSTKLPHNCFFNVTIPDSVIDIDQGAFSNGYIQDIIVRSERVKKLVRESGFQKNIIVDTNPKKRTRTEASKTGASKPEAKHEISNHGNQQNELMESKRKISVLERRLMDTEQKLSEAEKKLADTERELEYVKQKQQDADRKIAHLIGFLNGKYGFDPDYCYDNY